MSNVKSGVSVLRSPASPLSRKSCEFAKRNAGMPLPAKPTTASDFQSLSFVFLKALIDTGSKTKAAMVMRKAATSLGEKTLIPASSFKPRFIRKNELPQVIASRNTTNK